MERSHTHSRQNALLDRALNFRTKFWIGSISVETVLEMSGWRTRFMNWIAGDRSQGDMEEIRDS